MSVNYVPAELMNHGDKAVAMETESTSQNVFNHDILLTSAPEITLADMLSSTISDFKLMSGNYSWTSIQGKNEESVVACGAATLDDVSEKAELYIPNYSGIDKVHYNVFSPVSPDQILVREWNRSDLGNTEAKPLTETVYDTAIIPLGKNMVYEITLIWESENLKERRFSGSASYVFWLLISASQN